MDAPHKSSDAAQSTATLHMAQADLSLGFVSARLPPWPCEPENACSTEEPPHPGLMDWYRLSYHMALAETEHGPIVPLSHEQRVIFELLHDWWTARYHEPAFSLAFIINLLEDFPADIDNHAMDEASVSARKLVTAYLQLSEWPGGDIVQPDPGLVPGKITYDYHDLMKNLFQYEFVIISTYEPGPKTDELLAMGRGIRQQALQYAYCQSLAWSFGKVSALSPSDGSSYDITKCRDVKIPQVLEHGPILKPCPWLPESVDEYGNLPFYLWDRQERQVVETAALESRPQYVAISHTWGRWATGHSVSIPGVPWDVPQNTRFAVEQLPTILLDVPGGLRYIWLDLLCIPQDRSAIGTREIARQAIIFREANLAIAWLNEVETLSVLESIMQWMALQLLILPPGTDAYAQACTLEATAWTEIQGKQSGLLVPRSGPLTFKDLVLNPWFSSLWTLQEVCLRPDMWLCAKDWSHLSCDGNFAIPIGGVIAVMNTWIGTDQKREWMAYPRTEERIALFELSYFRKTSGLGALLDMDRAAIITMGDRRSCTGRRAEAIMSALGVVDWYKEAISSSEEFAELEKKLEKDLVLGKYPAAFVRELAYKIPRDFFAVFDRLNVDHHVEEENFVRSEGSMMPFCRTAALWGASSFFYRTKIGSRVHKTLSSWTVELNGAVKMPEVCVVSSNSATSDTLHTEERHILPANIISHSLSKDSQSKVAPLPEDRYIRNPRADYAQPGCNLHEWVAIQPNEMYAVLTEFRYEEHTAPNGLEGCGILLEKLDGSLLKTGHFHFFDQDWAVDVEEIQKVDWIVS